MMQHRRHSQAPPTSARRGMGALFIGLLAGLVLWLSSAVAEAREVVHIVQKGQYLNLIARRYHTTAEAIRKRNGLRSIDLEPGMKLVIVESEEHRKWREHVERSTGKKVKERVVRKKAPPAKPAPPKKAAAKPAPKPKAADTPKAVDEPKAAEASKPRVIRSAKQRVAPRSTPIVGADEPTAETSATAPEAAVAPTQEAPGPSYAKAPKRPGHVTLIRYGEKFRGQLVASNGKVIAKASQRVDRLLRSLRTGKMAKIDRRLLRLLADVSDHFGGRTIVIVSGFRPYSPKQYTRNSRHNHGQAVDFKVTGVPTDAVFEYCRQLDEVGCGYYPNSGFVHLDVRERNTEWTDDSRPGQAPKYVRRRPASRAGKAKSSAAAGKGDAD